MGGRGDAIDTPAAMGELLGTNEDWGRLFYRLAQVEGVGGRDRGGGRAEIRVRVNAGGCHLCDWWEGGRDRVH